jgi:hypothetical protein
MTPIERFFDIIDRGIQAAISFIDTLVSRLLSALGQIACGLLRVGAGIIRLVVYSTAFASVLFMGLDLKSSMLFWVGIIGTGTRRVRCEPAADRTVEPVDQVFDGGLVPLATRATGDASGTVETR